MSDSVNYVIIFSPYSDFAALSAYAIITISPTISTEKSQNVSNKSKTELIAVQAPEIKDYLRKCNTNGHHKRKR